MVLQTTTRGVGRVQKIQNGTILEKNIKKILKRPILSQNRAKLSKSSNITLQQNGEKRCPTKKLKQLINMNYIRGEYSAI